MGQFFRLRTIGWFHRQNPKAQKEMNNMFQEYKKLVDESNECKVVTVDDLDVPFTIMSVEFYIDERGKYNRAKKKQEDRKLSEDYLDR